MGDEEIDLEILRHRKAELIAVFRQRAARWYTVQNASLAAIGLGLVAHLGASLPWDAFLALLGIASAGLLLGAWMDHTEEKRFSKDMRHLASVMESLKPGGSP